MPKIIAFGQPKGGVGKSSLAVHLAAIRAREGARVLVIDVDQNYTTARWLHAMDAETTLPTLDVRSANTDVLPTLREDSPDYDLIVIDLPGYRGPDLAELVKPGAIDLLVAPMALTTNDVENLPDFFDEVSAPILTVFTRTDGRAKAETEEWREYLTSLGWTVARTDVRHYKAWPAARTMGRLVIDGPTNPNAKADALGIVNDIKEILK